MTGMRTYRVGDRVYYDENAGTVKEVLSAGRTWGSDYKVEWDNGEVTIVWGSDLAPL